MASTNVLSLDIFSYINELSISLQRPNTTVFKVRCEINATLMKLEFRAYCILEGNVNASVIYMIFLSSTILRSMKV